MVYTFATDLAQIYFTIAVWDSKGDKEKRGGVHNLDSGNIVNYRKLCRAHAWISVEKAGGWLEAERQEEDIWGARKRRRRFF